MPPRRSCFSLTPPPPGGAGLSFNATTAFLLQEILGAPDDIQVRFNATTAFLLHGRVIRIHPERFRFNATTAFLLRHPDLVVRGLVSGFNATTAFLLRPRPTGSRTRPLPVSMPPRRSCFPSEAPSVREAP